MSQAPGMHDFIREKMLIPGVKEMGVVIEQQIRDRFLPLLTSLEGEVRLIIEAPHLPTREHMGRLVKSIQKVSGLVDSDAGVTSDLRQLIRKIPGQVALAEEWVELGQFLQIILDDLRAFRPQKCNYWKTAFLSRILFRFADITAGELSRLETIKPVLRVTTEKRLYPLTADAGLVTIKAQLSNSASAVSVPDLTISTGRTSQGFRVESIEPGYFSEIKMGESYPFLMRVRCSEALRAANGDLIARFQDAFGNPVTQTLSFQIDGQGTDIDWQVVADMPDPYRFSEVKEQSNLYGRKEQLDTLVRSTLAHQSVIIYGQKRTGKSSLGRVLYHDIMINDSRFKNWARVYTDFGEIGGDGGIAFALYVGRKIWDAITVVEPQLLKTLQFPAEEIRSSYNALIPFLRRALDEAVKISVLVIIDEFDEMHPRYFLGEEGRAFFVFLRSLENLDRLVFVVIGGERVPLIDRSVGSQLNRARSLPLDYLELYETGHHDRVSAALDELIRRPSASVLSFSDEAVRAIAESSAGNPYFSVYICNEIFNQKVHKCDSYVDTTDVFQAIEQLVNQPLSKQFAHFWQDGHLPADDAELIEGRNIISLLAIADRQPNVESYVQEGEISKSQYIKVFGAPLRETLEKLVSRRVLLRNQAGYRIRVPFFWEWLRQAGLREVLLEHRGAVEKHLQIDVKNEALLNETLLTDIAKRFERFQGRHIEEYHLRRWLKQFGPIYNQNLALKVLAGVRLYIESDLTTRLRAIQSEISKTLAQSQGKELDLVAMGLAHDTAKKHAPVKSFIGNYFIIPMESDGIGSGSYIADLYRRTNNIWRGNVLPMSRAIDKIEGVQQRCVLLLVDDFICSGRTAQDTVRDLLKELSERQIDPSSHLVCIAAVIATEYALEKLQELDNFQGIKLFVGEVVGDEIRAFSEKAALFADEEERMEAKQMFLKFGKELDKRAPLGFDGSEALIVFERNCPNDSLPPLFKRTKNWEPLFERK